MKHLIVLGSINLDLTITLDSLNIAHQVTYGKNLTLAVGGKGFNKALGLTRLQHQVHFIGKIGSDPLGDSILKTLASIPISTQSLMKSTKSSSGIVVVLVDNNGDNSILPVRAANDNLQPSEVVSTLNHICKLQSISCLVASSELRPDTTQTALKTARSLNLTTFLDLGGLRQKPSSQLLKLCDFIFANKTEAEYSTSIQINHTKSVFQAALKLQSLGANHVIITLGNKGCVYTNPQLPSPRYFPTFKSKQIDSTAAGDAFQSAFISKYLKTHDPISSIKYAQAAGAFAVTKIGTIKSLPTHQQIIGLAKSSHRAQLVGQV